MTSRLLPWPVIIGLGIAIWRYPTPRFEPAPSDPLPTHQTQQHPSTSRPTLVPTSVFPDAASTLADEATPPVLRGPADVRQFGAHGDGMHDDGEGAAKKSVDGKGEPDADRGRFFMQALPATLAKLGYVVFHYDMVGYADSTAIVHREGFKDAEAELRLQSQMGLQTWNSLRALDFLAGLPDVDPKRLGMTGASGGGTQTFITAALDDRLTCAFPAVMVSTSMQGGCTCENASLLRVNTGNVEFAALFAPKPQGMTTANDWTKDMATSGFPELKQLYTLLGAPDQVMLHRGEHFPHNYNAVSRSAFYTWLNRHFKLGFQEPVVERDYEPLNKVQLSVWDAQHPEHHAAERPLEQGDNDDAVDAGVHAAGTGERRHRGCRPPSGCLRPRRDPLRDPDRQAALYGSLG